MSTDDDLDYTHPYLGQEARIEQRGLEVSLIFVCSSIEKADAFAKSILEQMKQGTLNIRMYGKPTKITEMNHKNRYASEDGDNSAE